MFLLIKILSQFTPKRNKLHLTTKTLFKAEIIRYTPNCTTYSFPNSLAMAWLQGHYFCAISEDF